MKGRSKRKKAGRSSRTARDTGGTANPKRDTRDKILAAAKEVFAEYPYSAASIRMVGAAAGIDHPLISYYFPTKADLFEAVLEDIADEYYQANTAWFEGLGELSAYRGLSLYIDRLLAFTSRHPEALRIVALNLVQPDGAAIIPGYEKIQGLLAGTRETFRRVADLRGPAAEVRRFTESFNTMVINYIGAATYYAGILGLDPRGPRYLQWVKETLLFLFLPPLRRLIHGEDRTGPESKRS